MKKITYLFILYWALRLQDVRKKKDSCFKMSHVSVSARKKRGITK